MVSKEITGKLEELVNKAEKAIGELQLPPHENISREERWKRLNYLIWSFL